MAELLIPALNAIGIKGTLGTVLGHVGASVLLSAVSRRLAGRPRASDLARDLSLPRSQPAKRFVYGEGVLATGSPAPAWVVANGNLYCCHILNSRPSAGITKLVVDKRYVDLDGDALDFSGPGANPAVGVLESYAKVWLGLGGQSGPPDVIMSEVGDITSADPSLFWPTDRWSGCTVLWGRYDKGAAESVASRWPAAPPEISAVGNWSRVWDPRDAGQDADDPDSWTVSSNAWLCTLDCLRRNPLARWGIDQIDIDSFKAAADDADALRARLVGPSEPRWRIGGTVGFGGGSVLLDVIQPMLDATGGDLMIDGAGITAIPATPRAPLITVTDWLRDSPQTFRARQKQRDVPAAVQASWPQPEAGWEAQTLAPAVVPGQTWTGGEDRVTPISLDLVPYPAQAMHLQQIEARRAALGRELTFTAGPELFAEGAQAGDWVEVDFGPDFASRNGLYMIQQAAPGEWAAGSEGVAFRLPVTLRETAESVTDWDPDTDEQTVYVPDLVEYEVTLDAPADLVAVAAVEAVEFTFTPPGGAVTSLEWGWRADGGFWQAGGTLPASATGGTLINASPLSGYDIRVRALGLGIASDWVSDGPVTPLP